jgi:hypothetical protein
VRASIEHCRVEFFVLHGSASSGAAHDTLPAIFSIRLKLVNIISDLLHDRMREIYCESTRVCYCDDYFPSHCITGKSPTLIFLSLSE